MKYMRKLEIQTIDGIQYKVCPKCGRLLPFDDYSISKTSIHGRRSWCKECVRQGLQENRDANRERCKAYYQNYYREVVRANKSANIQNYLYKSARARAKQRNIEFTIELEDVIVPDRCPILGIEMSFHINKKEDNSYSLDRIDPNQGYIKGNVWVISLRANRIKNDATVSELRMIADAVEQKLLEN